MSPAPVSAQTEGPVLLVTLDRPKANAIDAATSRALYEAFSSFAADPALRACVLTAAGDRFFSAGWDLKAADAGEGADACQGPGGFAGLTELFGLRKPVIAAINGSAYGGGVELMLAAHLVVASDTAVFALPEARLGILPDAGGLVRLPARLPRAVALELLLTGRKFSSQEAHAWGLVNRVVPGDQVVAVAVELALSLCRSAPLSVEATLEAVDATQGLGEEAAFSVMRSLASITRANDSADAQEGVRAFAERREPQWRGV